ncbi:unnamed protein product, partial [Amoebophrya sp. A25]
NCVFSLIELLEPTTFKYIFSCVSKFSSFPDLCSSSFFYVALLFLDMLRDRLGKDVNSNDTIALLYEQARSIMIP